MTSRPAGGIASTLAVPLAFASTPSLVTVAVAFAVLSPGPYATIVALNSIDLLLPASMEPRFQLAVWVVLEASVGLALLLYARLLSMESSTTTLERSRHPAVTVMLNLTSFPFQVEGNGPRLFIQLVLDSSQTFFVTVRGSPQMNVPLSVASGEICGIRPGASVKSIQYGVHIGAAELLNVRLVPQHDDSHCIVRVPIR